MIFSPRITNESLSVMLTNALSLSSFLREMRTSVISIMSESPRKPARRVYPARSGSAVRGGCHLELPASVPPLKLAQRGVGQTRSPRSNQVDSLVSDEAVDEPPRREPGRNDPENSRAAPGQVRLLDPCLPKPCLQGNKTRPSLTQQRFEGIPKAERSSRRNRLAPKGFHES